VMCLPFYDAEPLSAPSLVFIPTRVVPNITGITSSVSRPGPVVWFH